MIELPEALVLSRQMSMTLRGKRIARAVRGNAPHKFAFYNHEPEEYEAMFRGQVVGDTCEHGAFVLTDIGDNHILALGGGGVRIRYHPDQQTLPKKHQFLLEFADDTYLTATVQMWGFLQAATREELPSLPDAGKRGVSPLSDAFTLEFFESLFSTLDKSDARAIKFFLISDPGIWGVGNGCLQDILFRARIHPRRKAASLGPDERHQLYEAMTDMLGEAAAKGGRDSEVDLYGRPGGYHRIMSSETVGKPCPVCHTPIEKIQFLGGACYFCPHCQY